MSIVIVLASSLDLRQPATISRSIAHGCATLPVGVSPSGLVIPLGCRSNSMRVCIVQRSFTAVPTFIRAHVERLPGVVGIFSRDLGVPALDGQPVVSHSGSACRITEIRPEATGQQKTKEFDHGYETALRRTQADVVLAEYGTHGIKVMKACERANVPLVVHFHGADASKHEVLRRYAVGLSSDVRPGCRGDCRFSRDGAATTESWLPVGEADL